ncbi:PAS domain-containing protein [Hyphomonas sp. NPDC076900]|uniref:PAS domain-containing protein n=1 Tax=Hyphomonas sp. NPDC076900 TaxID=3390570 RepID=UPI003D0537A8
MTVLPIITDETCAGYELILNPVLIAARADLSIRRANGAGRQLFPAQPGTWYLPGILSEADVGRFDELASGLGAGDRKSIRVLVRTPGEYRGYVLEVCLVMLKGRECLFISMSADVSDAKASAQLRTMDRLLGLGWWECDVGLQAFSWSDRVYDLMGVPLGSPPPTFEGYINLIHPADRQAAIQAYQQFVVGGGGSIEFQYRILRPDGSVLHIKGSGERQQQDGKDVIVGVLQDVTSLVVARRRVDEVEELLKLAGDHAKFGAWHVDLETGRLFWTEQIKRIFGLPDDYEPRPGAGWNFVAREYRGALKVAYENCISSGQEFQLTFEIIDTTGQRAWISSSGRAIRDEAGRIVSIQGAFQDITAIREAEERTARSDLERVKILQSISDAFFALDQNWRFTYINPQAEKLLQRSNADLMSKSIWEEFPGAAGSIFQVNYEHAVTFGESVSFEEYFVPLEAWFEVSAYPMQDGLSVYFRDVTAQRRRDEHLRLLDAAVSRLNDILLITEAAPLDASVGGPRIVYVNDAFVRLTGFTRQEVIGQTPRILQGPGTDRFQLDRIRRALENCEPVRAELVNYSKDGRAFDLEVDIVPLADQGGDYTHWVAVQRDVSERKRAEEARRLSDERFRLVSKATNDVIWDWDIAANRIWWSDAITTVYGYPFGDDHAHPDIWSNRIHPSDREGVIHQLRSVITGTGNVWSDEYRFMRADGTAAIVSDQAFIIRDETGVALRILGSMRDMTEQRSLEQKLRESQKLEAVGQLTGGVAHDFNNLLTVILGNAEELSHLLSEDSQLRQMAEMTATAAARGAELTAHLLAFARRQPLQPMVSDLNRLIQGMEGLFRRTLSEDIDIEFVRCAGLWQTEVDPGQLEVALLNLMVNARDAMPLGGKLTMETANVRLDEDYAAHHHEVASGQYVMVSVTDTGNGMDAVTVSRAFEPFFTTKAAGKGSGLGLSMVFGFVKQSRGHIKIYSEIGEGTSVKLYFPRSHLAISASAPIQGEEVVLGGAEQILLVEDDDLVREHLANQLAGLGYRVLQAASGPEAIGVLWETAEVDLLLTDIVMPGGMNGRELAERACHFRPGLKVLFTSGYTENAIVHHGRLDPGVELLSKPYRRKELAAKVRKVLDGDS